MDSGAGINVLKRKHVLQSEPTDLKQFSMGYSKFNCNEKTYIRLLDKRLEFYVVEDSFPLIEDGIIGLPALRQCQFQLSNDTLTLDNTIFKLQQPTIVQPRETLTRTVYLEGNPTPICFINGGESEIPITNFIENTKTYDQITNFKELLRLSHIEKPLREPIEEILIYYMDVFNLETNFLPCTNLTEHVITPKEDKILNTKSYRPPECHKQEITDQVQKMLDTKIIEPSDSPYNAPV